MRASNLNNLTGPGYETALDDPKDPNSFLTEERLEKHNTKESKTTKLLHTPQNELRYKYPPFRPDGPGRQVATQVFERLCRQHWAMGGEGDLKRPVDSDRDAERASSPTTSELREVDPFRPTPRRRRVADARERPAADVTP